MDGLDQWFLTFYESKIHLRVWLFPPLQPLKLKDGFSSEEKLWQSRQCIKKQIHYFADKGLYSQSYGFSSSHVWMWELDHKEGWAPKNWCFWIVVVEKTLESPLDCEEIKPVNPKGNQHCTFIGRTEAEAPIFSPPDAKSRLIRKDFWCWERLKAGEEGGSRGHDGLMALPNQWTWVWANSKRWWRTGKPGVLQFMGLQRVRHDRATEQQRPP